MLFALSFIFAALLGCSEESSISPVSEDEYSDQDRCWEDEGGNFASFFAVREFEGGYTVYPISAFCYVSEHGGDSTLNYLRKIKIRSDRGLIGNKISEGKFFENYVTDTLSDKDFQNIYVFHGGISRIKVDGFESVPVFDISLVNSIRDTGWNFNDFRKLSPDERSSIFEEFSSVAR